MNALIPQPDIEPSPLIDSIPINLAMAEASLIATALLMSKTMADAATLLGIDRRALARKSKELGLSTKAHLRSSIIEFHALGRLPCLPR